MGTSRFSDVLGKAISFSRLVYSMRHCQDEEKYGDLVARECSVPSFYRSDFPCIDR